MLWSWARPGSEAERAVSLFHQSLLYLNSTRVTYDAAPVPGADQLTATT